MIERGRGPDPRAVAHRRTLASKVQATREKLTSSGSGFRAFDVELMRLFARTHLSSILTIALLAAAIGGGAALWLEIQVVLLWFTIMGLVHGLSYAISVSFLALNDAEIAVKSWKRKFILAEALRGVAWAMIFVALLSQPDEPARTFVLIAMLLAAAMTSMTGAGIPGAVFAGVAPLVAATCIFMSPWTGLHNLSLAAMAVGAQLYFVVLARRLYASALQTLALSMEKEELISELEQSKANSDEARRRAEEANLAKSRFLATMSHELRTPLNAILGFSEVLKGELFGAHAVPAYKEYSGDIHSSGQHLLMLINEILDLSRVEAGRYELKEESVSLAHVVEDCHHLLKLRAEKRQIVITEAIEPGLPRLWADERAIRQVALNLLTNAIKFTPQGGTVTIKVGWTASGGQYFSVRDTGPGIPENEIPTIMSSFGRGALAQKNAEEGTGLGLPIVKGLVELHGGTFKLKSEVRVGTEVIVILPPERVMDALPQISDEHAPPRGTSRKVRRRAA